MINFRYHLVSLVAVFLALSIGIVMGSTVIDRAIVDSLRSQIKTAEKNSIERKIENDQLKETLNGAESQITSLGAFAVQGSLADQNVYVLTVGDVSDTTRVETLELLATSGSRVPSVIRFNTTFLESNKDDLLREVKKIENVSTVVEGIDNKDSQINKIIQEALAVQAGKENVFAISADEVITFLIDNDVFEQQEKVGVEVRNVSFLFLTQRTSLDNDRSAQFLSHASTGFSTSLGFAGTFNDKPSRSDAIEKLGSFIESFQIVDNVEMPSGRVSLVLAHSKNIGGERTIYGISNRATSPAPIFG